MSLAFVSPSLLGVLIFFVLPFFVVIYYAFVNNPVLHEFVGFDNFRNLFQNQSFRLAAKNTAIFSLISVPSAVIGSLLLASDDVSPPVGVIPADYNGPPVKTTHEKIIVNQIIPY